jgi:PTS system N-acetylglucosamine-specific IIC component
MSGRFQGLQQLGRALMLPIAVLPIAGLLLRLGQPDLLDWHAMAAAGDAIFSNLGLMFAVGVGVGLARENHGAAGLAALVGYLVTTHAVEALMAVPASITTGLEGPALELALSAFRARELTKLSVPVGLLSGIIAGHAYNRFSNVTLPSYLSFFGGRRFVPIVSGLAGLALAAVLGQAWPLLERGMDGASAAIIGAGSFGLFAYGVLNRILIVTGLHHILNNFAWFIVGDYHGATGDLRRFFAGDPTAGAFMTGFFPVMMFGLPGACLAMYRAAAPARRAGVAGLLLSLGLTSFLTGVTEPVEFTFMFLAPLLYALHALATGLSMVIMHALHVRLGFSFSAGLFDYLLNFSHAERPWLLLPVGAVFFGLYYLVFRFCILRFNLATPGRERGDAAPARVAPSDPADRAREFVAALGGGHNLVEVAACTTRLRLVLADHRGVDEAALRRLGARGVLRTGTQGLQVVLGPMADQVAGEIRTAARAVTETVTATETAIATPTATGSAGEVLDGLGGSANLEEVTAAAGRVLVRVRTVAAVDEPALRALGIRAIARTGDGSLQLILPQGAEAMAAALRSLQ